MKTYGLLLLTVLLAALSAQAQLHDEHPISHDPVFAKVLKRRLAYPHRAGVQGIYERVYVGFNVNEKGHVGNVSLLSPPGINHHFDHTVTTALRRMPPLNPRYAGRYAMPVVFALIDRHNGSDTLMPPVYAMPPGSLENRTLLRSVYVIGESWAFGEGNQTYYIHSQNKFTPLH